MGVHNAMIPSPHATPAHTDQVWAVTQVSSLPWGCQPSHAPVSDSWGTPAEEAPQIRVLGGVPRAAASGGGNLVTVELEKLGLGIPYVGSTLLLFFLGGACL